MFGGIGCLPGQEIQSRWMYILKVDLAQLPKVVDEAPRFGLGAQLCAGLPVLETV